MNVSISNVWRLRNERLGTPGGGLWGSQCPEGHVHFPQRIVCPECATALLAIADVEKQESTPIAVEFPIAISAFATIE